MTTQNKAETQPVIAYKMILQQWLEHEKRRRRNSYMASAVLGGLEPPEPPEFEPELSFPVFGEIVLLSVALKASRTANR
jgi:hypothetical protein